MMGDGAGDDSVWPSPEPHPTTAGRIRTQLRNAIRDVRTGISLPEPDARARPRMKHRPSIPAPFLEPAMSESAGVAQAGVAQAGVAQAGVAQAGVAQAGVAQAGVAQAGVAPNPFRQPKAVWAVAFACVNSFMGIGLVDPILPALRVKLHATPSQVELLFTSYLVVGQAAAGKAGSKRLILPFLLVRGRTRKLQSSRGRRTKGIAQNSQGE
jgi:hypothetical protein